MKTKFFEESKEKKKDAIGKNDGRLAFLNIQQQQQGVYKTQGQSLIQSITSNSQKIDEARTEFSAAIEQKSFAITKKISIYSGKSKIEKLEKQGRKDKEEFFSAQQEGIEQISKEFVERRTKKAEATKRNNNPDPKEKYEVELNASEIWESVDTAMGKLHKTDMEKKKKKTKTQIDYKKLFEESSLLSEDAKTKKQNPNIPEDIRRLSKAMDLAKKLQTAVDGNAGELKDGDITDLIADYKQLDLKTFPLSAMYLGEELKSLKKEAKIILYHCIYSAVKDCMDNMQREHVEVNQMGDIVAFVEVLDQAFNALRETEEFQRNYQAENANIYKQRKDKQNTGNASQEETEWLKNSDKRKDAIVGDDVEKGKIIEQAANFYFSDAFKRDDLAKAVWIKEDDYKENLMAIVKDELINKEKREESYFTQETILRRLHFISERLNQRMSEIWNIVIEPGRVALHKNVPVMVAKVCAYIAKKRPDLLQQKGEIKKTDLDTEIQQIEAIRDAVEKSVRVDDPNLNLDDEGKSLYRYEERRKKIKEAFDIDERAEEALDAWQSPEIQKLLMREPDTDPEKNETEESVQADVLRELEGIKKQREANMKRLQNLADEAFGALYRQDYLEVLKKKLGIRIAMSAPAPLMVAAADIYRNMAANDMGLATRAALLKKDMKKVGIKQEWSRHAEAYLQQKIDAAVQQNQQPMVVPKHHNPIKKADRNARVAELKAFLRAAKGNIKHFEDKVKDLKYTEKQWKDLLEWKDRHVAAHRPEDFKAKLEAKLSRNAQAAGKEGMSITKYLYQRSRAMFSVEERIRNEIKGDKLLKDAAVQKLVSEDGDMVLKLIDQMLHNKQFKEVPRFKDFEELHQIDSIGELGELPYGLYEDVVQYIKENLKNASDAWTAKMYSLDSEVIRLNQENSDLTNENQNIISGELSNLQQQKNLNEQAQNLNIRAQDPYNQKIQRGENLTEEEKEKLDELQNQESTLRQKESTLNAQITEQENKRQQNEDKIKANTAKLSKIPSADKRAEIKKRLLEKMVKGDVNKTNMTDVVDDENEFLSEMDEIRKKKFEYQIVRDKRKKAGSVSYEVGEGVRDKHAGYKALKRNVNFRYAEQAWEFFKDDEQKNLMDVFIDFVNAFKKEYFKNGQWKLSPAKLKKEYEKRTAKLAKSLQNGDKTAPKDFGIGSDKWNQAKHLLSNKKLAIKEETDPRKEVAFASYIREMMMLRTEEFVFSTGGEGNRAFLYGDDEQYFNKMLEITTRVSERAQEILSNRKIKSAEERRQILFNMRYIMAGMKEQPNPEEEKAYKERFGVKNWEEALRKTEELFDDSRYASINERNQQFTATKDEFNDVQDKIKSLIFKVGDQDPAIQQTANRVDYNTQEFKVLDKYLNQQKNKKLLTDGGVKIFEKAAFKAMLPYIMENDKYLHDLMKKRQSGPEFFQYLGKLVEKISEPLLLLTNAFAFGEYPLMAEQFAEKYHKEILAGTIPAHVKDWEECVQLFKEKNTGRRMVFQGYRKGVYKSKDRNIHRVKEWLAKRYVGVFSSYSRFNESGDWYKDSMKSAGIIMAQLEMILTTKPEMEEYFYDRLKLFALAERLARKHDELHAKIKTKIDDWLDRNANKIKGNMEVVYGEALPPNRWAELKEKVRQIMYAEQKARLTTLDFDGLDSFDVNSLDLKDYLNILIYKEDKIGNIAANNVQIDPGKTAQIAQLREIKRISQWKNDVESAEDDIIDKKMQGAQDYYKESHVKKAEELRKDNDKFGSAIIARFVQNKDSEIVVKQKSVENARNEIRKTYGNLPAFIQECLVERWLALKIDGVKARDRHITVSKDALKLNKAYNKVKELAATDDGSQMSEEYINKFLLYLYTSKNISHLNAQNTKTLLNGDLTDDDYENAFDTFTEMLDMIEEIDIDTSEHSLVQEEQREFKELALLALFTTKHGDLRTYVDEKKAYINNLKTALAGFEKAMAAVPAAKAIRRDEDKQWDEKVHLLVSLKEYFLKNILDGTWTENQYQNAAEALLVNEKTRMFLFKSQGMDAHREDIYGDPNLSKDSYKNAHKKELHQVSAKDMGMSLSEIRSNDRKAEIENELYWVYKLSQDASYSDMKARNHTPLAEIYHKLRSDEKELFFMILEACEQTSATEDLASAQIIRENSISFEQKSNAMKDCIEKFIKKEPYAPQINYDVVKRKLFYENGEVNWDNFEMAMEVTRVCMKQRSDNEGNDWEKMANATSSIASALNLADSKELVENLYKHKDEKIENALDFKRKILVMLHKDSDISEEAEEVLEMFDAMFEEEDMMSYLIIALQNRTYMDQSTAVGFFGAYQGYQIEHANEEGRNALKELLLEEGDSSAIGGLMSKANSLNFCTKAFRSLLSFQLKDDVDLRNRSLKKRDFVDLNRKTTLDIGLLKAAISFAKEMVNEKNRLAALRQAPDLIKESGNKKAEAALNRYKDDVTNEETFLQFLTLQAIQDDAMSEKEVERAKVFLASYHSFTPAEKELFVSVLQHRDLLDVSQKGYAANMVGFAERDYVNATGRNALMDEYLANSYRSKDRLKVSSDAYQNAFKVVLSTQINDDADFSKIGAGGLKFVDKRKSAVDWKLIGRAIQFVKRTTDEEIIRKQDEDLYYATGDVEKHGAFEKGGDYMRKNLRQFGSTFTRGMARYLKNKGMKWMPATLKGILYIAFAAAKQQNKFNYIMNEGEIKSKPKVTALGLQGGIQLFNDITSVQEPVRAYMRIDLEEVKDVEKALKEKEEFEKRQDDYRTEGQKLGHTIENNEVIKGFKKAAAFLDDPLKALQDIKDIGEKNNQENQDIRKKSEENGVKLLLDGVKGVTMIAGNIQEVVNVVEDLKEIKEEVDQKLTHSKKAKVLLKNAGNQVIKALEDDSAIANLGTGVKDLIEGGEDLKEQIETRWLGKEKEEEEEEKKEFTKADGVNLAIDSAKELVGVVKEIKELVEEENKWDTEEEQDSLRLNTAAKFVEGAAKIAEGVGNILDNDLVKDKAKFNIMDRTRKTGKKDEVENLKVRTGYGQALDYIKFGRKVIKVARKGALRVYDLRKLSEAEKKGKKHIHEDEQKRYQAGQKLSLSKDQRQRLEDAYNRNARAKEAAGYGAHKRGQMDVGEAVAEAIAITGDFFLGAEEVGVMDKLVGAVMDMIKLFRQKAFDKNMARRYFDLRNGNNEQLAQIKNNYTTKMDDIKNAVDGVVNRNRLQEDLKNVLDNTPHNNLADMKEFDLMKGIYGFEGDDEFVAYSSLSMIHSLLYSASKFGESMKSNHIVATAVLIFLDCRDCIGKLDSEAALKVQTALRGQQFS